MSIFAEDQLEKIYMYVKQPITSININGYFIQFYEQPDVNANYIISCDVAGGLSQDNSAILIIAPDDFRIVGDFRNNKIDTDNVRKLIERMVKDYFRNAILIIERNSYGLNLLQYFMKDRLIEPRMVQEEKEHLGEKTQKDGFTVKKKTKNIVYGIDTNQRTRKLMFELLPEIIDMEYDKIISPKLYEDIAGLERKKNGKIEHSSSSHDDSLMAYLIFRYALHYGKSLKDRFKINAIPSKSNLKIVSGNDDFKRIQALLDTVQTVDSLSMNNNQVFNYMKEHQDKIKEKDSALSAFERIADLNR